MASNVEAHAKLCNITFGYLKSMALDCAIKLGIPKAIDLCGGGASLADILAAVPVSESKRPCLARLMRLLAASGIFSVDLDVAAAGEEGTYSLTPVSRLLVADDSGLSPFVLSQTSKHLVGAAMHLPDWFKTDDPAVETPFRLAHGADLWGVMGRHDDAEMLNQVFNAGMASHSRFEMDFFLREQDVFQGVTSLVDVGGGTGTAARAIARAFPHVRCSVLDLPNVINSIPADADGAVDYIAGDMMKSIPSADAVLLKHILHDWDDEDCVKILTQCRKAIPAGGKVIILDMVVGSSPSIDMLDVQLQLDLLMMAVTSGKERDEKQWSKIFKDAGFSNYKTMPVLGMTAITQLYP